MWIQLSELSDSGMSRGGRILISFSTSGVEWEARPLPNILLLWQRSNNIKQLPRLCVLANGAGHSFSQTHSIK